MLHCNIAMSRRLFTIRATFEVEDGELFCLYGASASGKTSLLSALAGLEPQANVTLQWDTEFADNAPIDQHTPSHRRRFAYVAQTPALFPHLTVRDNLAYGAPKRRWHPEIEELAERFGLLPYLSARPSALSGGLKQRVNLARALASKPRLLLLDEPLSALDADSRRSLQDLILDTHRERHLTTILVTHQLQEAQRLSDKMAILADGRLLQYGAVDDVMRQPCSIHAAKLLGYTHFLQAIDFADGAGGAQVAQASTAAGSRVWAIHPDRVLLGAYDTLGIIVKGHVTSVTPYHGQYRATVSLLHSREELEMTLAASDRRQPGDTIVCTLLSPPLLMQE